MYYYLYEIINKVNSKIYVGVHKTDNLDDGYMGSGKIIRHAIEKYGIDNFDKRIIQIFDNSEDMFAAEAAIVNEEFLLRDDVYNLRKGGTGGFDYINANKLNGFCDLDVAKLGREKANSVLEEKYGFDWRTHIAKNANSKEAQLKRKETIELRGIKFSTAHMQTPEVIEKRKISVKLNGSHVGEKNSQYGRRWATNGEIVIRLERGEALPSGFSYGKVLIVPKEKTSNPKIEEYKRLSPVCRNKECSKELSFRQWMKNATSCSKSCSNKTRHLENVDDK